MRSGPARLRISHLLCCVEKAQRITCASAIAMKIAGTMFITRTLAAPALHRRFASVLFHSNPRKQIRIGRLQNQDIEAGRIGRAQGKPAFRCGKRIL